MKYSEGDILVNNGKGRGDFRFVKKIRIDNKAIGADRGYHITVLESEYGVNYRYINRSLVYFKLETPKTDDYEIF